MKTRFQTLIQRLRLFHQARRNSRPFKKLLRRATKEDVAEAREFLTLFTPVASGHPMIRVGGDADGGYLIPDDLEGVAACFSPGVADAIEFDLAMARMGIPGFLLDGSVDGLPNEHPLLTFEKQFLGSHTNEDHLSLDDWVQSEAPPDGDLVLQMDIEGAEYDVLNAVSEDTLKRFRTVVLEVHWLEHVFDANWRSRVRQGFEKLNRHFAVVHLHHNNHTGLVQLGGVRFPRVFEITYLRRDRLRENDAEITFPHPLDQPNRPDLPDFEMPRFWEV